MRDLFQRRVEQRRQALDEEFELLGWSFDPLDAQVAHVTLARLGAIVERVEPGDHRLIAEWWLRAPHVEKRLWNAARLELYEPEAADAPVIRRGDDSALKIHEPLHRLWIEIPLQPDGTSREFVHDVFAELLDGRYRIVDFVLDNPNKVGRYLLARKEERPT